MKELRDGTHNSFSSHEEKSVTISTAEESSEAARMILRALAKEHGDDEDKWIGALGGFLGNLVGHIPEEFWEKMCRSAQLPCDDPGCDCATVRVKVFEALEDTR